ncbi:HWE histidine kinase domain-containing protein [Rhizobium sp. OAE497]|uniref:sensor histidine kinase n=1 Tax=Rhizobium sp. OAE497 TaxID=2663796 RepID=UPI0018F36C6C
MTPLDYTDQQATPLAVLTHAIAQLAGARDASHVVEIIRSTARSMIGCQGIAVIRKEDDLCHYIEEDAIGTLWKGQKFPASACVSGWAMAERKTIVIPDIDHEDRVPRELYQDTFVRAIAMTPVRPQDPIGAIGAYWAAPYQPTRMEIEILEALASAAATAIENVRLIVALSGALEEAELARDELRHRVKNAYMGAQSLAKLSIKGEAADDLVGRIQALSRAHSLLDERMSRDASIDIRDLTEIEVEPYRNTAPGRIVLSGPSTEIDSTRAVPLGLSINELATNALKHGALSIESGTVEITWSRNGEAISLSWIETNGPRVGNIGRTGEGSGLLARLVERQLRGTLEHIFDPAGVRCRIAFRQGEHPRVPVGVSLPVAGK